MGFVYIVADNSSDFFKFGCSTRDDETRVLSYRTAMCKYTKVVVPCGDPRSVESAMKAVLRDCIQVHCSGRRSEICSKGLANCNMLRAINVMLAAGPAATEPALLDEDMSDASFDGVDEGEEGGDEEGGQAVEEAVPAAGDAGELERDRHFEQEINGQKIADQQTEEEIRQEPIQVISSVPEHVIDTFLQHYPAALRWSRDNHTWITADGDALPAEEGNAHFKDLLKQFAVRLLDAYSSKLPSIQRTSIKRTVNAISHPGTVERFMDCLRKVLRVEGKESGSDEELDEEDSDGTKIRDWLQGRFRVGGHADFISCKDLYKLARCNGMSITPNKLGRKISKYFGISSFGKRISSAPRPVKGFMLKKVRQCEARAEITFHA